MQKEIDKKPQENQVIEKIQYVEDPNKIQELQNKIQLLMNEINKLNRVIVEKN